MLFNLHWVAYGNTLQFEVLAFLWDDEWMCDLQMGSICKEETKKETQKSGSNTKCNSS